MKPDSGINNRTLVEECIKGDRNALNMLYTRFAPKMLGVIRRYIQNPDDAEDILHDGFIVAYTRLSSLRDFNRIDVWLATIMKNLSLRFLNSQDVSAILHELPDVPDTPEIEDIIDIETLERLMLRLPDGYRKVFRLAVLENKTHKEIGKLLGIAPNSSSSQLFHARMMMRKLITDYKRDACLWQPPRILISTSSHASTDSHCHVYLSFGICLWRQVSGDGDCSQSSLRAERRIIPNSNYLLRRLTALWNSL